MASNSVQVLAPNGRRQTVKCTPNTTIMQIIEEVCKKQGFKAEDYDIKHHNKVLDTTNTFRFSGLPNNAQLELATAVKARVDSDVILAVNLENGDRIMGNFQPDNTLLDILNKLCPEEVQGGKNAVVIYTRREIYGPDLGKTTLRSLGLRGGRAMIRLIHKSPEELKVQANVSAPLPTKPVEEKPYVRTLKTDASSSDGPSTYQSEKPKPFPMPQQKKADVDILKLAREKRKLPESPAKTVDNEIQSPKTKPKIEPDDPMEVDANSSIAPLKSEDLPEDNFIFLGERNAMLFSLETAQSVPSDDLPEDFFELTLDDAKKILKDIRMKRHNMENGTLMTSDMRNLEESKKQLRHLNRYKKSVIRVQFPDRTILQGIFTPTETIRDVVSFIRDYLEDKSMKIYVYTTPPKCVLPEESRLMEVGCVPGALLHLGSDSQGEVSLKSDMRGKFTTNSMASLAASKTRQQTTRVAFDADAQESEEVMDLVPDLNSPGTSSQSDAYERKVVKTTEKVPKWFKPSK